jgi:hypothetical protein
MVTPTTLQSAIVGLSWVEDGDWPTFEMSNRGGVKTLFVGTVIALFSGAGVALSMLSDNASSLVGVAIRCVTEHVLRLEFQCIQVASGHAERCESQPQSIGGIQAAPTFLTTSLTVVVVCSAALLPPAVNCGMAWAVAASHNLLKYGKHTMQCASVTCRIVW